jgi:hypothetical protein
MTPYSLKDPKDPLTAEGAEVAQKYLNMKQGEVWNLGL